MNRNTTISKIKKIKKLLHSSGYNVFDKQHFHILKVIAKVQEQHLSYLESEALWEIAQVALQNEKKGIGGVIIETGCALGGSSIVLASAKDRLRKLFVYDVFGTIPSPSERDDLDVHERYNQIISGQSIGLGNQLYYGYEHNLYEKVVKNVESFLPIVENNINLVKGLYETTLNVEFPVALAHIDCDWYDSVWICLQKIEPHLVNGGTLIIDDYYAWSGAKRAVDEYFRDRKQIYKFIKRSRLHIQKI
jgi:asparagine synthase (glutamine-hydrolysing)